MHFPVNKGFNHTTKVKFPPDNNHSNRIDTQQMLFLDSSRSNRIGAWKVLRMRVCKMEVTCAGNLLW